MPLAQHISLLALRQILSGPPDTGAAEALARRCDDGDPALMAALQRAHKLAWSTLEIVVAGESFWDGCTVFLPRGEHSAFRRQIDALRARAVLGDRAELRQRCVKELRAARSARQVALDGAALASALRASDDEQALHAATEELKRAGCPAVAEAFLKPGRDGEPALLPAALGQFLRHELSKAGEKASSRPLPPGQEAALTRIGEILAAHGRGLQEWLDDDGDAARPAAAPAAAGAAPAAQPTSPGKGSRLVAWMLTLFVLLLPLLLMLWMLNRYTLTPAVTFEGHTKAITSVAFAPGGKVVSASFDGTVRVWDAGSGKELDRIEEATTGWGRVSVSPDGKRLLVSDEQGVSEYDAAKLKWKSGLQLFGSTPVAAAITSAGARVLNVGKTGERLELRDFDVKAPPRFLDLSKEAPSMLTLSADGKRAATADRRIVLWDLETLKRLQTFEGHPAPAQVSALALSADGSRVVSGGTDETIRLWDAGTGKQLVSIPGPSAPVAAVALSPDGQLILSGSGGRAEAQAKEGARKMVDRRMLRLWEAATGRDLVLFESGEGGILAVAFAPDGRSVLSGGEDCVMRLWKLP